MELITEMELDRRFGITATILNDLGIRGLQHIQRGDFRVYDLEDAYSDPIRPVIPIDSAHPFRRKAPTHSD